MVKIIDNGVFVADGREIVDGAGLDSAVCCAGMMASKILAAHNFGDDKNFKIKFDAMASHDITYVGIVQTARASGLEKFPVPYVLTNCHNSLCAVGGTINEDDHVFGLSAAEKYGGIFVPAHLAVIHSYMREMMSGCGKMILGSDSHTRYGALGTMAIGEGGPELAKQLLGRTYDIASPDIIAVRLTGKPRVGVGPQDVSLALVGEVFKSGFVKNKVLEFIGDGILSLPIEYRNGIDVMTTETTCLSTIWRTDDDEVKNFYKTHGREDAYKALAPDSIAYYAGLIDIDLSKIEPMIALPFHPSNVYKVRDLVGSSALDILRTAEIEGTKLLGLKDGAFTLTDKFDKSSGRVRVDQGVIAGCAGGTFDNLYTAAQILKGSATGAQSFALSAYPGSQPIFMELIKSGAAASLMASGVTLRTAFCGPCFGAGDVPANGGLSIRHSTRNFENREGSKPGDGQLASVALMDARSIAATAKNNGLLTAADEIMTDDVKIPAYTFDNSAYESRVYSGYGSAKTDAELKFGPNITDWPSMEALPEKLALVCASVILDPVTTTDELIPSGESSSYRSNPLKLARLTLSRKDPKYVGRADDIAKIAADFKDGTLADAVKKAADIAGIALSPANASVASIVCAKSPGDGSAREQAASCQKVLGGRANLAIEYATKRYRSNLINWGMLPLQFAKADASVIERMNPGDVVILPNIKNDITAASKTTPATIVFAATGEKIELTLALGEMTADERDIILAGCLMNYYKSQL
jgi:Aconitase A